MGCDIHMYVERKVGQKWCRVSEKKGITHPYYEEALNDKAKNYFNRKTWTTGRNYKLFGLLAGVRSSVFLPFFSPRGLPSDLSAGCKREWKLGETDWHSASYLTLTELLSIQDKIEDVPCFLDVSSFREYKKTGKLPEFYHHYPPVGVIPVSNEKMERIMELASFLDESQYWTQVENKVPVKEISKTFFVDIIAAMQALSKNTDKVRCVFWFDN